MDLASGFAHISVVQLVLVAAVALFASVVGGVAGYGTGALMPLVLVPIVGPEPVVPIIAISSLFSNTSRATVFRPYIDLRRATIAVVAAIPFCLISAYGYTRLDRHGAALVIGTMLIATVPIRRALRRHDWHCGDGGLALGAAGYGLVVGGTVGAGVVLLSLLMAAGLDGAAVIATDAVISIAVSVARLSIYGLAGVLTPQVVAFALLIGFVTVPGAFLAKRFVERMPVHVHTAILDVVVVVGGATMIYGAFRA